MPQYPGYRPGYSFKGLFFTVFSLAMTNIAGDNMAVVPLMATALQNDIYGVVLAAYFGIGACLAGISAWIGAIAKDELPQTVEWNGGKPAKDLLAWAILGVCLPASALTGGFFAGAILADIFGVAHGWGAFWALLIYAFCVRKKNKRLILSLNTLSLLTIPLLLAACFPLGQLAGSQTHLPVPVDRWTVIWALVGYNACGLRPVLLTEAGACFHSPWLAVGTAVAAKWLEGAITLFFAYSVVESGAAGLLPIGQILENHWGMVGRMLFLISLLTVIFSCMVPAMDVNAHQIKGLTGLRHSHALCLALIITLSITFLGLVKLLGMLAIAGLAATLTMLSIGRKFTR